MSALTFFEALQKSAPTGCGVLVIQDGKLLTGTRMDNGRICGPGGHIEPGEAPEEAAKREAFEEFGITCKNLERIGTIPGGGRYCTSAIFLCTSFSGTPEADGEEMTDASWRTLEEIKELDLFLSFERSLSLLGEDVKKFNHNHDPKNGRFTTGSNDADYMKAISDGDIDSVSKMVKNAAVRAGYRVPAFHGTPSGGITSFNENSIGSNTDYGIFGRGFYFSTNKKTANRYKGESGEVMPVYLKVDNPYWMNGKKISDVAADLNMDESAFSVSKLNSGHIVHPMESTVSQFTSHLIEKGYDSVVVQHGSGDYEVVVFSNKQIKSAELVTRGDDGEVIPLSERFKSDNSDIRKFNENHDPKNGRFTTGTGSSDEKYLKAVSSGDTETAQIMVNDAADRAGYKTEAYHGTTEYDTIKSFKKGKSGYLGPGIYLALNRDQAQQYADKMGPGNGTVYNLRVKANKPFVAKTNDPAREILKEIYGSDKEYEKRSANRSMATMWIQAGDIKKLQKAGYDSVKWDFGKYPELMVFDPSQVKSSDAVTYDKKNPVPLSEWFDSESKYIAKYNHNHDPKTGRFTSGSGGSSGSGVSEEDQKYWDVVDSGDDKAAKKMLDEAAAEKGFTEIWSHGSNDASFTEFDLDKATGATAVFLSDRDTASMYAGTTSNPVDTKLIGRKIDNTKDAISEIERITGEKHVENDGGYSRIAMGMKMKKIVSGEELIDRANRLREGKEKGGVYDLYVNKGKCLVVEAGGKFWNEIKHEYGSKTDDIARKAKEKGYDSVEIRDVVDGAFGYNASDILVVFDPARLKSADIDVYDGDRRIPLSERFSDSKDIRKFDSHSNGRGDVNLKVAKKFSEIIKYNHNHDPKNSRFTTGDGGSGSSSSYGANGVTTKDQDEAYAAAVAAGDMETAQQMVIEAAKAAGAQTFANPDTPAYSIRRGAEPQETVTVYKTFFVDENGNPSALFVEGGEPLPVGVWLDAKDAYHFTAKNGKDYTPSRKNPNSDGNGKTGQSIEIPDEETRQELIKRGFLPEGSTAKSVTALAYRPGWHAGDLPFFPQGGKQGNPVLNESGEPNKRYDPSKPETNYQNVHRWNQVVFECEMIADKNYTNTSLIQSGPNKGKTRYHDMQTMPSDGYYQFATNPMTSTNQLGTWYISGSLKIKRALSQSECDKMLTDKGFKVQEWEGGTMSLDNLHYDSSRTSVGTKLLDAVTYDDSGKMIPLSDRFNPNSTDVRKSMEETVSIYKTDEDKRLVFGWASVVLTVDGEQLQDRQNDMIDPDDLEEAVYEYVLKFRDTGEEHVPSMRKKGKLVESCVLTKEKQEAMGIPEGIVPVGWWIGFKIEDDDAWARVKDGTYKMFSIEGKANREEIGKGLEEPMAKSTGPIIDVIYEVGKSSRYDHISEVMKFNDNHDPENGRFTFAPGGAKTKRSKLTPGQMKRDEADLAAVKEGVAAIRSGVSNNPPPIKRENVNIDKIMKEGGCDRKTAEAAAAEAKKIYDRVSEAEPKITGDIVSAVSKNGGVMYGLPFRMKQETSLGRKIASDAKADFGGDLSAAAADVKDAVRYTAVFEGKDFTAGYKNVKSELESMGYHEDRCKNFWQMYRDTGALQKSVQCVYSDSNGNRLELQFHTYESHGTKEVSHPMYEKQRSADTSQGDKNELKRRMRNIYSQCPDPDGVYSIKGHS